MTRWLRIALACGAALLVIGTGGLAALKLVSSYPQTTDLMVGAPGGPFRLTATDGSAVTDRTYRGKWVLIYFGYTSCPDACPTALNSMGVAILTGQLTSFSYWLLDTFPILARIG